MCIFKQSFMGINSWVFQKAKLLTPPTIMTNIQINKNRNLIRLTKEKMKFTKERIVGIISTLLTGSLTLVSFFVFFSGFKQDSKCEFCSIMLAPGIIFFVFFIAGLYTLFCNERKLMLYGRFINIINITAIILSVAAIIFNLTA